MWKVLHQWTKPERLYQICGRCIPWLAIAATGTLLSGWIWGFGFVPLDYQQGDSVRIMYLHVPAAMGLMAIAAFIGLVWQMKMADFAVAAIAPVEVPLFRW